MEVDVAHSVIERRKKYLKTMDIAVPHDWAQFIRTYGTTIQFDVFKMDLTNFKNASSLGSSGQTPFLNRKKNTDGDQMLISKAVLIKCVKSELGILYYKNNISEEVFKRVDLRRFPRRSLVMPDTLPALSETLRPISSKKYKHLMDLLKWVPESCKTFYLNLRHNEEESDSDD